jgi:hypothetical protein
VLRETAAGAGDAAGGRAYIASLHTVVQCSLQVRSEVFFEKV